MTTELATVEQVRVEVAPVVARARELAIVTPQDYADAAQGTKDIKSALKKVDDFFDPAIGAAHKTWKATLAQKATVADPLKHAENILKSKQLAWRAEQERVRLETQRKLQAEADARAAAERTRLEKEAAKLKTPELRQARMDQAAAVVAPVVEVSSVQPEVKGQSFRKTWKARVVDVNLVPREWLVVNQSALDAFARFTKGAVGIAGVEMFEETGLASASR